MLSMRGPPLPSEMNRTSKVSEIRWPDTGIIDDPNRHQVHGPTPQLAGRLLLGAAAVMV